MAEDANRILTGKTKAILNQLRILGGSPGGARPKVTIGLAPNSDDCVAGLKILPPGFGNNMDRSLYYAALKSKAESPRPSASQPRDDDFSGLMQQHLSPSEIHVL